MAAKNTDSDKTTTQYLEDVLRAVDELGTKVDVNMELGRVTAESLAQVVVQTAADLKQSTITTADDLKQFTIATAADLKESTTATAAEVKDTAERNAAILAGTANTTVVNIKQGTASTASRIRMTAEAAAALIKTAAERDAALTGLLVQSLDVVAISVNELSRTALELYGKTEQEEMLLRDRTRYFVVFGILLVILIGLSVANLFIR